MHCRRDLVAIRSALPTRMEHYNDFGDLVPAEDFDDVHDACERNFRLAEESRSTKEAFPSPFPDEDPLEAEMDGVRRVADPARTVIELRMCVWRSQIVACALAFNLSRPRQVCFIGCASVPVWLAEAIARERCRAARRSAPAFRSNGGSRASSLASWRARRLPRRMATVGPGGTGLTHFPLSTVLDDARQVDYVLAELRGLAELYDATTGIEVRSFLR